MQQDPQVREQQIKRLHRKIREYSMNEVQTAEFTNNYRQHRKAIETRFLKACSSNPYRFVLAEDYSHSSDKEDSLSDFVEPGIAYDLHSQNYGLPQIPEVQSISQAVWKVLGATDNNQHQRSNKHFKTATSEQNKHRPSPAAHLQPEPRCKVLTDCSSTIINNSNASNSNRHAPSHTTLKRQQNLSCNLQENSVTPEPRHIRLTELKSPANQKQGSNTPTSRLLRGIQPRVLQWEFEEEDLQPQAMKIPSSRGNVAKLKSSLRHAEEQIRSASKDHPATRHPHRPSNKENTASIKKQLKINTSQDKQNSYAPAASTPVSKQIGNNVRKILLGTERAALQGNRTIIRLDSQTPKEEGSSTRNNAHNSSIDAAKGLALSFKYSSQSKQFLNQSLKLESLREQPLNHLNSTHRTPPKNNPSSQLLTSLSNYKLVANNSKPQAQCPPLKSKEFTNNNSNFIRMPINLCSPNNLVRDHSNTSSNSNYLSAKNKKRIPIFTHI